MCVQDATPESIVIRVTLRTTQAVAAPLLLEPMTSFRILFVCIGNVCRSPLGERLLRSKLSDGPFEVSSAGVGAMVGSAMDPEAAAHLVSYGGSPDGFLARQLTPAIVRDSDLVLAATTAIRSRVLEDSPAALRRTFTVLELAALLDVVPHDVEPTALVRSAAEQRSRAALDDYDIPDPYGRGDEAHLVAARAMAAAVDRIAKGLVAGSPAA
jgi:protein-tyrosine phosphatase